MSSDDEIELSQKMNHCVVPEFEIDDNDYYPSTSISSPIFTPSKKSTIRGDEEIMELVWRNGQIIVQSQSQNRRCMKKSDLFTEQSAVEEEDEMNSLLQSPVDDSSSFADLLYTTPTTTSAVLTAGEIDATRRSCTAVSTVALPAEVDKIDTSADVETIESSSSRLIIPQLKSIEGELTDRLHNYLYTRPNCAGVNSAAAAPAKEIDDSSVRTIASSSSSPWPIIHQLRSTEAESIGHFSRLPGEPILRNCSVKPSTVVEPNDKVIAAVPEYTVSRVSDNVTPVSSAAAAATAAAAGGGRQVMTQCELTLTSSTTGSAGSVSACAEPLHPVATAAAETVRKRKSRESDDNEGQSEDVGFDCADAKKQVRSSTSAKKSRSAKVHNLSERKRRDRINEKMRALRELIPRCNKTDKVSMLDEAIEYLKSLQLQVQMMSTGCNMVVPMVYPGIPQYMPTMGMNIGMAMNRPMVPYPPLMPGPAMQMAPQYPLPACHLPSRIPAVNQPDPPRLNSQNFSDPYHQYFGLQQAQLMLSQSQRAEPPSSSKPNSCVEGSAGNHQSG